MRRFVSLGFLTAFALAVAPVAARAAGVASVGHKAPAFLVQALAGGADVTARDFAGRPLVLNVFASWCPPCREELPRIAAAARSARGRTVFLGIDEQEAAQIAGRFAREMRLPYAIALDEGQFAASYGAVSLPVTIFVDASGIVRAIQHGEIDAATLARDLALVAPRARPAASNAR